MTPGELVEKLRAAVAPAVVPRAYLVGETDMEPPCCVFVPPLLTWGGPGADPTDARMLLALVVDKNDRSARQLLDLVVATVEALDTCDVDVVARSAEPGTYPTPAGDAPAYLIEIEAGL